MRKRLREKYSDEELKNIYAKTYEHNHWNDHIIRVQKTIEIAKEIGGVKSVADLSAGDAIIINSLDADVKIIGDYTPGYEYCGQIEETIKQIPNVDLFICSETLEHIDNPLELLKSIRNKTSKLLLTTPDDKPDDNNPEHYWAWDADGIEVLLRQAGFKPMSYYKLELAQQYYYDYQIWVCE